MLDKLDKAFSHLSTSPECWEPGLLVPLNLTLLVQLQLFSLTTMDSLYINAIKNSFTCNTSPEKITLYNDRFVSWITPLLCDSLPVTYIYIARNPHSPTIECIMSAKGVFNSPKYILPTLSKMLDDITETQHTLASLLKRIK